MPHRYNLRNRNSPVERPDDTGDKDKMAARGKFRGQNLVNSSDDADSDFMYTDEEDTDAEDAQHLTKMSVNTSKGSGSSYSVSDNSHLSTTASDSFSFQCPRSPNVEASSKREKKLYPELDDFLERQVSEPRLRKPRVSERTGRGQEMPVPKSSPHRIGFSLASISISIRKYYFVLGIMLVAVVLFILFWNTFSKRENSLKSESDKFKAFCKRIDRQNGNFPGQDLRFWKVVKAATQHVIKSKEPAYPAVMLMAADKNGVVLASGLAEAVAEDFMAVMEVPDARSHAAPVMFNISQNLSGLKSGEQKQQLDRWLKDQFQQTPAAVVLHHLEALLPDAALLLHGYCDGDNAPHKNVLMILVVYMDTVAQDDRSVEVFLSNVWTNDHSLDKVDALLSRVANNIGILKMSHSR